MRNKRQHSHRREQSCASRIARYRAVRLGRAQRQHFPTRGGRSRKRWRQRGPATPRTSAEPAEPDGGTAAAYSPCQDIVDEECCWVERWG